MTHAPLVGVDLHGHPYGGVVKHMGGTKEVLKDHTKLRVHAKVRVVPKGASCCLVETTTLFNNLKAILYLIEAIKLILERWRQGLSNNVKNVPIGNRCGLWSPSKSVRKSTEKWLLASLWDGHSIL
jgi:hypothetical protein